MFEYRGGGLEGLSVLIAPRELVQVSGKERHAQDIGRDGSSTHGLGKGFALT